MTNNNKDYQKIIKDNPSKFNNGDALIDFIDSYLNDKRQLTDLGDYISEYVDNSIPIYYDDIVKQWHANPDCHGLAVAVQGKYGSQEVIYTMMTEDLFFYAEENMVEDFEALLDLVEDTN
jgi:hypothetical protein